MTTIALPRRDSAPAAVERWWLPAALLLGLAAVAAARWLATRLGLDPLAVGIGFGLLVGALALGRPTSRLQLRPAMPGVAMICVGVAAGLALVALAAAGSTIGGVPFVPGAGRPAGPFLPWALVTVLVAWAEEALIRGRLFDAVRGAGGVGAAVVVSTVAFALLHVPLYGWGVVPLDLAVGLLFAGLRLVTRGIAAPAAAHMIADLATWWI
jgi:membrane protease YdiL (CAAX protease family)